MRPRAASIGAPRAAVLIALIAFVAPPMSAQAAGASAPRPVSGRTGSSSTSAGLCERGGPVSVTRQDEMLRLAARVMRELDASGASAVLVSRAGTDLRRFGLRYSHAGIALKDNPGGAWAVRQLYYVCDESRPRLFDQGLAAFLMAGDATGTTFLSMVSMPAAQDLALARAALDKPTALRLLGDRYSANANAFSWRYQNCNQWVAELMGIAWEAPTAPEHSATPADPPPSMASANRSTAIGATAPRARAQQALRRLGYEPETVEIGSQALMFAAHWIPLLHVDDHPLDDLYAQRMRVSLPTSLERFMTRQSPRAARVEMCLRDQRVVIHRGASSLGEDCSPASPQDEVIALD